MSEYDEWIEVTVAGVSAGASVSRVCERCLSVVCCPAAISDVPSPPSPSSFSAARRAGSVRRAVGRGSCERAGRALVDVGRYSGPAAPADAR